MSSEPLRVLVVDDSAMVRQTLRGLLEHEGFEVVTAADPLIAMQRMAAARPDVILLDIEMPRMDGLEFLRRIMATSPLPVVICSAYGTSRAFQAIEEGAIEIVTKPQAGVRDFLRDSAVMISDVVRAAAAARPSRSFRKGEKGGEEEEPSANGEAHASAVHTKLRSGLIAVGASTGGTEALRVLLRNMSSASPGMAIVQHMPAGFTRAFARSLQQISPMRVREARDGERIEPGLALLAPGGLHMAVECHSPGDYRVSVHDGPLVSRHRPSVDVLFHSVAHAAGPDAIGILLTGMGDDGAEGLQAMRNAGANTIAQDEATSIIFGMPRAAIRRGAAAMVLPIEEIGPALARLGR